MSPGLDRMLVFFKKSDFLTLHLISFLIVFSCCPVLFVPHSATHLRNELSPSDSLLSSPTRNLQHFSHHVASSSLPFSIFASATKPHKPLLESDIIEDVNAATLFKMIEEEDYLAVFFYTRSCEECKVILEELEKIDDDADRFGVQFVSNAERAAAKKFGITEFPKLLFFRHKEPLVYEGDLMNEEQVLEWLTSVESMDMPDKIEEATAKTLPSIIDNQDYVAVLFYQDKCKKCDKAIQRLEEVDDDADRHKIGFVKIQDKHLAYEYGLENLPALVYYRKKIPIVYEGDLEKEQEVLAWLLEFRDTADDEERRADSLESLESEGGRSKEDVIELVDKETLQELITSTGYITVLFYPKNNCKTCDAILKELEEIDDETDKYGIHFVKTEETEYGEEVAGITEFPSLVYFEEGTPSIYDGNLLEEEQVLAWLVRQKTEDTIENVNRDLLFRMVGEKEYIAALFYKRNDDESEEIIEHLENIDDDCGDYEVHLVKICDHLIAKKYGVREPPGLVFFRRGKPVKYEGDLFDEFEVLEWLTRPENMESADAIEKVNRRMFDRLMSKLTYLAVLFYSKDDCKQCDRVLEELEKIDDEADQAGIKFVKIDDAQLAKSFGVYAIPALVFFKKSTVPERHGETEPIIYAGDLKKGNKILEWLIQMRDPGQDKIEEVDEATLRKLLQMHEHVTVFFYQEDCKECKVALEELENIDTETDKHGIVFVKTADLKVAEESGIKRFPSLVYFEKGTPSIYEGELTSEEDVLQWLILQKTEDTIESVNRELLEQMIETSHYLVAFFYKPHCRACDVVLEELEHIDDECDLYGIHMIKIQDVPLAKRYGIRTFPALLYFRNGNPLLFDGDLRNEDAVLEWLIDDDNRELQDEIEDVNARMLEKLVDESPLLVVLFYDDECIECPDVLQELEEIDDELDVFGIDFVKVNDQRAFDKYDVHTVPALAFFRKKEPIFYDGDLMDEEKVLEWLTSDEIFELKDEIEEVNKKMLEKLLNENDYIAVYFYDHDCEVCETVLKELERIDDEADDLEVMFVKIKDMRYAKKYGITTIPTLVFFRKKFPSVYRGDLMKEEEVLEWLRKNRYRPPEIGIFMYSLIAVTIAFVLYTIFILCFLRPREKKE